jgi:hypothetical protein
MKAEKVYRVPLTEGEVREIYRQLDVDQCYDREAHMSAAIKLARVLQNIHRQR